MPAHVDARRDDREHAGRADRRGREEREVARQEGDHHLERRVVEPAPDRGDHVADDEADPDAADDAPERAPAASRSENVPATTAATANLNSTSAVPSLTRLSPSMIASGRRGTPSRRPIVGRRDRIGRRDDRAEDERRGPRQAVDHAVRDHGDRDHRRDDEPEREQGDRPEVLPQLAQSRCRTPPSRGAAAGSRRARRPAAADVRNARDEARAQAAEHEQDRIRDPQRRATRSSAAAATSRPAGQLPGSRTPRPRAYAAAMALRRGRSLQDVRQHDRENVQHRRPRRRST